MATYAQADRARTQHAQMLQSRGAHAVSVVDGAAFGLPGFVIQALYEPGRHHDLPSSVSCPVAGGQVEVPVAARAAGRFRPESP